MTNIVYIDDSVIVVNKASGLATVPLSFEDDKPTLLRAVGCEYPEVLEIRSKHNWEGGTLHRLDTLTSGLVLFARTQYAFDRLMVEQYNDRIIKTYLAKVHKAEKKEEGFEPFPYGDVISSPLVINSYFRPYGPKGAMVRPVLNNILGLKKVGKAVLYTTQTSLYEENVIECQLTKGFRHQVRAHLAWSGYPLDGDELYGGIESERFGLFASSITFKSPDSGKMLTITA